MRRAANASLARLSCSPRSSIKPALVLSITSASAARALSIASRSAASSSSPSSRRALWIESISRVASRRASPRARASMSARAFSLESCSICSIRPESRPKLGLTWTSARLPVLVSSAATLSRPSASTWKVTFTFAAPATIGGMPRRLKRASERHSPTSSRSP